MNLYMSASGTLNKQGDLSETIMMGSMRSNVTQQSGSNSAVQNILMEEGKMNNDSMLSV